MRTIDTTADLAVGLKALVKADPRLRAVARLAGELQPRRRPGGFAGLARIVVGQQLSIAAAASIWAKFEIAFPEPGQVSIAAASAESLKAAGLSAPKIRTLRAMAAACGRDLDLDLDGLAALDADEAHGCLTAVSGIGPWSADIYLMFCLGHADIFPVGDLALRTAVAEAFGLAGGLKPEALRDMAQIWAPWRSVAATLFWAYYSASRAREGRPA